MAGSGKPRTEDARADAIHRHFERDVAGAVEPDVTHSGRDLPDVNLDALCDLIFAELGRAPSDAKPA